MDLGLDGKIAVITGAVGGMGEESARILVDEGAKVVLADILDAEGGALANALGDAIYVPCRRDKAGRRNRHGRSGAGHLRRHRHPHQHCRYRRPRRALCGRSGQVGTTCLRCMCAAPRPASRKSLSER